MSNVADDKLQPQRTRLSDRTPFENLPLSPPAVQEHRFDSGCNAWILSRHRDVLTALRSPFLSQARPIRPGESKPSEPIDGKQDTGFSTVSLPAATYAWAVQMERQARASLERLDTERQVDLVVEFIRPWCLDAALSITGVDARDKLYLADLIGHLNGSDSAPDNGDLKKRASGANKDLHLFFQAHNGSSFKSLFLGLAQTLPTFIASAWAALLQHPDQFSVLNRHPDQIPKAIEELLRYAGPVHTLFREAEKDLELWGEHILSGDRLILRVASANRDPEKFVHPDRLDITRDVAGHLALSAGAHSCPGASIVRLMTAIATRTFLEQFTEFELSGPVVWSCGTMLTWPSSLPVSLSRA